MYNVYVRDEKYNVEEFYFIEKGLKVGGIKSEYYKLLNLI